MIFAIILCSFSLLLFINIALHFPDSNDFYELSRICLLMDNNIKYCVNNNWGFAHPISCWLSTKITGDLLLSQRLINIIFFTILLIFACKFLKLSKIKLTRSVSLVVTAFIMSPWVIDLIVSVHMDIVPVTLIVIALYYMINGKSPHTVIFAGLICGISYWFRFHYLSFALLFPIMTLFFKKENRKFLTDFISASIGILFSIAVPHILCEMVYGVLNISNQKFVIAQAIGIADWSYQFAQRLEKMTINDMIKRADYLLFMAKYIYRLLKSGLFPVILIFLYFIYDNFKRNKTKLSNLPAPFIIAGYAAVSVIPFTVLRGFTYRLEAAMMLFMVPLILWILHKNDNKANIIALVFILNIAIHSIPFQRDFIKNRNTLLSYSKLISNNIPEEILKEKSDCIICCVDYYNPYNRYRLCNPMVFIGWGVRFKPLVENFGFLDLTDPFDNTIYKQSCYIVLPPDQGKFKYSQKIQEMNKTVFKNDQLLILKKEMR